MCLIVLYYYKIVKGEINYIMKIKGPFMKVMSSNEVGKRPLSKPNFDMEFCLIHFDFSISILFNKHNFS
jgi:hypothetical protein